MTVFTDPEPVARHLIDGGLAVIPTDTVYGVAGPLTQAAVDTIFQLKQRPREKALPILAADAQALLELVNFDGRAYDFAEKLWPGPFTLVLPRNEEFRLDLGGDGRGVAVRVPAFPMTLALLKVTGPLVVTSANASGQPPATDVNAARRTLTGPNLIYLDGGETPAGDPSAVISLLQFEPEILRHPPGGWSGGSLNFRL